LALAVKLILYLFFHWFSYFSGRNLSGTIQHQLRKPLSYSLSFGIELCKEKPNCCEIGIDYLCFYNMSECPSVDECYGMKQGVSIGWHNKHWLHI